jgi:16S rRNA (cytidine1402-2'-O)-methyltransferase
MLSIVATPIGNLEDITYRAVRILSEADAILCEDTRTSSNLLNRYGIKRPLVSFHAHSSPTKIEVIISMLLAGEHLAIISDAGTPGISDPLYALLGRAIEA